MSFEQEARANADSRGFLNRLTRRQLLSEVAKSTRDQLGVSIKKIRAELHVNEITNWLENIEGMKVGGAESVFEPDGNEVKIFNMFEQPYPGTVYTKAIGGNLYRYMQIPDAYKVVEAKYPDRETRLCNPSKTAIFFDGASAHLDLGADTAVWSKTINKFSLRIRIRPTEVPITTAFRNVLSVNDGVDGEIGMWFDGGPSFVAGITTAVGGQSVSLNNEEEINDTSKWYDFVLTYDKDAGANNMKLYVDGVLKTFETHTGALQIAAATKFWIGRYEFDAVGDNQYKGYAADFMFWSNAALTQTDVTNITNGDIHKVTVPDYWLPMNDGITNPTDIVSGTKTGAMNNLAEYQTIDIDSNEFVWVKNGITGSYPVMLRTGYSLGLNLTTVDTGGVTIRRNGQFLAFDEENWFSSYNSFNGTSDFISEADKASLDLTVFTVACIFRCEKNVGGGTVEYLINKGDYLNGGAGQNHNYGIYVNNTSGKIYGEFQTNTSVQHFVGGKYVTDGKWHVAVLTYSGTVLKIFVDGVLIQSQNTTDVPDNATADPLVLGRFSGSSSLFLKGDIAEAVVWNTAITDAQVIEYSWTGKINNLAAVVYTNFMGTTAFDGIDDGIAVLDSAPLDLLQFSIAARFRSRCHDYTSTGMIINKGGEGSDTAGQNMNYGLWFTASEFIQGGFEEGAGTNREAISPLTYADNELHTAIITYDQVNLRLYIDGILVHAPAITQTPETNALDLRIGQNARTNAFYFMGEIIYTYVWNNDLTVSEVRAFQNNLTVPQTGAIVYSNLLGQPRPFDILSNNSDFNWEGQNFSESIWFYATDLTNTGKKRVIKIFTLDVNNYYSYCIDNADNKLFIEFVKAGVATRIESTIAVTANAWHHLALTWQFTTPTLTGRLDDVAMTSSSKVGHAAIAYHKPCYGGYPRMMYHEQFMGMIDAHIYYKHDTVLTTGEMTNLKNFNTKYTINASRDPAVSGAFMSA